MYSFLGTRKGLEIGPGIGGAGLHFKGQARGGGRVPTPPKDLFSPPQSLPLTGLCACGDETGPSSVALFA